MRKAQRRLSGRGRAPGRPLETTRSAAAILKDLRKRDGEIYSHQPDPPELMAEARHCLGMTQGAFARALGHPDGASGVTISFLERGKRPARRWEMLMLRYLLRDLVYQQTGTLP